MEGVIQDIARIYDILSQEDPLRFTGIEPSADLSDTELYNWEVAFMVRVDRQVKELGFTIPTFNDLFNGPIAKAIESRYIAESLPKMERMAEICGVPLRVLVSEDADSARMRQGLIHSLEASR